MTFDSLLDNFKIIDWTPYQSVVLGRFAEFDYSMSDDYKNNELYQLWETIAKIAKEKIGYRFDNKTVIHLSSSDSRMSILVTKMVKFL